MRKIYVYISNTLLEEGRRPSLEEVAEKTVQPLEVVKQVLDVFESVAGIYRDPVFKNVIAFYPGGGYPNHPSDRTGRQWTHRIFALRHGRADVGTDLGA